MASTTSPRSGLQGEQRPRVSHVPDYGSSAGQEAVELAAMAGLELDPWEALVLRHALGERADGRWAAFEVGVAVARQNGKGAILEARELAGLFLLGERLLIHSAHQFDTSLEAFRRLLFLIEDTPSLERRVKRVSRSHGEEGIELKSGQRIRFRTRTKGGGRGFSGDCLVLDEAMYLPESAHGALLPTLSARPNPQVWYTGSAVDQWVHDHGVVFARIRERGHAGDEGLAWFEWCADGKDPSALREEALEDPAGWAAANPALGIRISHEHIDRERRSMERRTFAVERLGVGDWPATDSSGAWQVIEEAQWRACTDTASRALDPVCLALDVTPDRSASAIAAAGKREDGLAHVEVVEHKRGTGWVVDRVLELVAAHGPEEVVCDGSSPAASLLPALERNGVEVTVVSAREHAQACGLFYDAVSDGKVRYVPDADLTAAVRGAERRPLGDAWAWSRKSSATDISPVVACTLAHWASADGDGDSVYEDRGFLTV